MRVAFTHGERLELASRREQLRAYVQFRRARIDDFGEPLDQCLLFRSGARILDRVLIIHRFGRFFVQCSQKAGCESVVEIRWHGVEPGERRARPRVGLRDGKDGRVGNDPGTRQIAFARESFSPDGDAFGTRPRLWVQLADAAQPFPRVRWVRLVQPRILECGAVLRRPVFPPQILQSRGLEFGDVA